MVIMEKRKRGGQKGNQNARKHGFYAERLTTAQIYEFCDIINTEGLDPELAALRVKLRSCLSRDPDNVRVIREASKLIAAWYSSRYGLDKEDSLVLKRYLHASLDAHASITSPRVQSRLRTEIPGD